ncbi:MAG: bifunctional 23S rRNA (guanine(2069)-N(7))-methyltransferase RlmK/23S rRNA (guanine(2445)-N(2))-methyltransferase RlmL, partial [Moraxella sp.]|nr:bifunctional 23S rRNA (guanine(2069)-N(7))-methyltransferase RlmK/23S rRNA (guanine(2445)-N(2))-methyltransferase RlmL [Moraxella sp.]
MTTLNLHLTCADGLEQPLLTELATFGMAGEIVRMGRVAVATDLAGLYQLCLYSRVASRVLLPLGEYHFKTKSIDGKTVLDEDVPEALYTMARRVDWTAVFGVDNTFVVRLSAHKKLNINQQFATLRIKDGIVDTFTETVRSRPNVDSQSPEFIVFAAANERFAELALDLSGGSLHRRGYRVTSTAAPLKENLAAALLYETNWHTGQFDALIDPMCGSGTFIIEALLMRAGYPVGLHKASSQFGFYHWRHHDEALWYDKITQAEDTYHANLEKLIKNPPYVAAFDVDAQAVKACHQNLIASGLGELAAKITLAQRPLSQLKPILAKLPSTVNHPLVLTNPPYGERLGDESVLRPLYQGLGLIVQDGLKSANITHASLAVLGAVIEDVDTLPIVSPKTLQCHNGALNVYFRHGELNLEPKSTLIERFEKREIPLDDTQIIAQEFINRLQKNLAALKKHAKREQVSNLRIYDADLPNFNVAVDIYGDFVHVQEYAPPKSIPEDVAKARFNLALFGIREVLGVKKEQVFIKTRAKQSGNDQYTKQNTKKSKRHVMNEDEAYLYVNFTDYLDTGLFIDHRNMRELIKNNSRNKKVLNLFAYTCTASVQAALGGAKSVVSVDLSANYLEWGRANFALNGFDVADEISEDTLRYQFIDTDVFEWLKTHTQKYDVIFIDPPTFSNSKKFYGTFDIQRDHVALINRAMNRLAHDGILYFSNNFSKFVLDDSLNTRYEIENITSKTIGFDFNPKKPIHQSFVIRHHNHA